MPGCLRSSRILKIGQSTALLMGRRERHHARMALLGVPGPWPSWHCSRPSSSVVSPGSRPMASARDRLPSRPRRTLRSFTLANLGHLTKHIPNAFGLQGHVAALLCLQSEYIHRIGALFLRSRDSRPSSVSNNSSCSCWNPGIF